MTISWTNRMAAVAVLLALAGSACGGAGTSGDAPPSAGSGEGGAAAARSGATLPAPAPRPATPVVTIEMDDFEFEPEVVAVEAGETVELHFVNNGTQVHDAFVGTVDEQLQHGREMAQGGDHQHHGDNAAVTVEPGGSATLSVTFDEPGLLEIGCHQPGHYEAGMRMALRVT